MKQILRIIVCSVVFATTAGLQMVLPLARSCSGVCPSKALARNDVVFAGILNKVGAPKSIEFRQFAEDYVRLSFIVTAIWKGPSEKTINVYVSEHDLRNRQVPDSEEEHYIVFASLRAGGPLKGKLTTDYCARTKQVTEAAVERLVLGPPLYATPAYASLPEATLDDYYYLLGTTQNDVASRVAVDSRCLIQYADQVVPQLIAIIRGERTGRAPMAAVALSRLGPIAQDALPTLEWALSDGDDELRVLALHAICGILRAPDKGLAYLVPALKDPVYEIRYAAVAMLESWSLCGGAFEAACCGAQQALYDMAVTEDNEYLKKRATRAFERIAALDCER